MKKISESILDTLTDTGQTASGTIAATADDEWFGRDEDWSLKLEYKTSASLWLLDDDTEEQVVRLWEMMTELFSRMSFTGGDFTLIFEFEWDDAQWQQHKFIVESVETTTTERFRRRLAPMRDLLDDFVDNDTRLFFGVEMKFENTSGVRFHRFRREMMFIYTLLIRNYKDNDCIKSQYIQFAENRMNNEASDVFCATDLGGTFTEKQLKFAYARIYGRNPK